MLRYRKYNYLAKNLILSKYSVFNTNHLPELKTINVEAGHFKLNSLYVEHGLIFTELINQLPIIKAYQHGKRLKRTVTLFTKLNKNNAWNLLDRFIHYVVPSMEDFQISKRKRLKNTNTYQWRLQNFFEYDSMSTLLTERILRKNVFLPLTLQVKLTSRSSQIINESYLHMLRLPFVFYKKVQSN